MWQTDTPDMDLIRAYLAGDQTAFTHLYERYRRPLYAYLNRLMPGAGADDLFQQTWIKAIDHLPRYEDRQTFLAWLCRIAHNAAIDHFRRARNQPTLSLDEHDIATDPQAPVATRMASGELQQALQDAIAQLPPEQREVLLLRQQGVAFKEIAEIQDISINTVLGRMHYAVNRLRQHLRDHL